MAMDALEQEYGGLPPWAERLRAEAPGFYGDYLALRGQILREGVLSRKEKDLLLVGVNAARRYRPSLLGHARLAVRWGASPEEVLETILVAILSRGIPSWMEGLEAVRLAEEAAGRPARLGPPAAGDPRRPESQEAAPSWLAALEERSPAVGQLYGALRANLLRDGHLPRLFRELVLVAINLAEGYEPGVRLHAGNARRLGAGDAHLVETALTTVLTAGIPAWFNVVPHLGSPEAHPRGAQPAPRPEDG